MKLRKMLLTTVLVASMGTSAPALAATPHTQTAHASSTRSESNIRRVKTSFLSKVSLLLNINYEDLVKDLQSGESLTNIASESGVSKTTLIAQLLENEKSVLDQEVSNGNLSLDKKSHILYKATSQLSTLLDRPDLLDEALAGTLNDQ